MARGSKSLISALTNSKFVWRAEIARGLAEWRSRADADTGSLFGDGLFIRHEVLSSDAKESRKPALINTRQLPDIRDS